MKRRPRNNMKRQNIPCTLPLLSSVMITISLSLSACSANGDNQQEQEAENNLQTPSNNEADKSETLVFSPVPPPNKQVEDKASYLEANHPIDAITHNITPLPFNKKTSQNGKQRPLSEFPLTLTELEKSGMIRDNFLTIKEIFKNQNNESMWK